MSSSKNIVSLPDNLIRFAMLNKLAGSIYHSNSKNHPCGCFLDIANEDVRDFLLALHRNEVKYMLAGGIATVFHGHIRTTQDLNLWVKETPENKRKLIKALEDVGVAGAEHYYNVPMIPGYSSITIGSHGFTADFMEYMHAFSKEDFDACYEKANHGQFETIPITVIHINHLIKEKEKLARPKDLDDAQNLKRIRGDGKV